MQIINDVILPCIETPRSDVSEYAPKILQTTIPLDKIREVIGAGGKVINKIIAETKTEIDIDSDTGVVNVSTVNIADGKRAIAMIEGIAHDPEVGAVFSGKVTRLMTFGAFIEFLPGKEGLVHISKMSWSRVDKVEDVVKEGDIVNVKVMELDSQGRINLSMRDCTERPEGYVEQAPRENSGSFNRPSGDRQRPAGGGDRPRPYGGGGDRPRQGGGGDRPRQGGGFDKPRGGFRDN
jgi:polyribonucleotide nucleotidyltransferase